MRGLNPRGGWDLEPRGWAGAGGGVNSAVLSIEMVLELLPTMVKCPGLLGQEAHSPLSKAALGWGGKGHYSL